MIFLFSGVKYKKIICLFLIFFVVVFSYFANTVNNHVKLAHLVVEALENTSHITLNNIKKSVFPSQNVFSSFELNVRSENKTGFCLINDNKDDKITFYANNLKFGESLPMNICAWADNSFIGFRINDNPELSYTAKSLDFKSTWNDSVYSVFFDVPSFVPDDLSYKEINKFIRSDNVLKILFALNFKNVKTDYRELINNIDICDLGTFPLYTENGLKDGRLIRLNISAEYIKKVLSHTEKASSASEMKLFAGLISKVNKYIQDIEDNRIVVDMVLYNNAVYSAETSFHTDGFLNNVYLKISGGLINVAVKQMIPYGHDSSIMDLRVNINKTEGLKAELLSEKKQQIYFDLKRINPGLIISNVTCSDKSYKITLSENVESIEEINNGKNIYKLSVSDLYHLYQICK